MAPDYLFMSNLLRKPYMPSIPGSHNFPDILYKSLQTKKHLPSFIFFCI